MSHAQNKNVEWATWQCATCQVEMDDPVTITETMCANDHMNYLGPILPSSSGLYNRGSHRRAFVSRKARAEAAREDRHVRDIMRLMAKGWEIGRKQREAKERAAK